jgi:hypothetical protein
MSPCLIRPAALPPARLILLCVLLLPGCSGRTQHAEEEPAVSRERDLLVAEWGQGGDDEAHKLVFTSEGTVRLVDVQMHGGRHERVSEGTFRLIDARTLEIRWNDGRTERQQFTFANRFSTLILSELGGWHRCSPPVFDPAAAERELREAQREAMLEEARRAAEERQRLRRSEREKREEKDGARDDR